MPLRTKILLILASVAALYAAVDHAIQRFMVSRSFEALEEEEARKDLRRAVDGIGAEVAQLAELCRSWAVWDDTFEFARASGEAADHYVESNLGPRALESNRLELLYVCDKGKARVLWGRIEDPETGEPTTLRDFPGEALSTSHPLIKRAHEEGACSGLLWTESGALLVSAHPILDSRGEGPSRGTVLLGRFLGPGLVESLSQRTSVDFDLLSLEGPTLPAAEAAIRDQLTAAGEPVTRAVDDGLLYAYTTLSDLRAIPRLILRASLDRSITQRGWRSVQYSLLSTAATALLILFVLLRLLQRVILNPLRKLTDHAVHIGQTEDTSAKLEMDREDEIGILSSELDRMMEKLARSRAQLAETARAAGMSEIATGVLHNVGNVLNSVNVSANLVARSAGRLNTGDLERMTEILEEHREDLGAFVVSDPRGRHLLPFLGELTRSLGEQKGAILAELASLSQGVEHVIDLVRSQQAFAGRAGLLEPASLAKELDSALNISLQANGGDAGIEVVREYEDVGAIPVDRHRLMEILVNLIQNAKQAMDEADGSDRRLVLRVLRQDGETVRLEVEDSGVGIEEENLTRIFNHGFTTKADGHGFGLHASANAATEIGGQLHARSPGAGRGAVFSLDLPARAEPVPEAA